jgi:hypothetical protein
MSAPEQKLNSHDSSESRLIWIYCGHGEKDPESEWPISQSVSHQLRIYLN